MKRSKSLKTSGMGRTAMSSAAVALLLSSYRDGEKVNEIAFRFGVSKSYVSKLVGRQGESLRMSKKTRDKMSRAARSRRTAD
jgi:transposase